MRTWYWAVYWPVSHSRLGHENLIQCIGQFPTVDLATGTWYFAVYWPVSHSDGGFFLACKDLGEKFNHSFPACAFFFYVEICSCTLIPPSRPGSVHSGSASRDNCGRTLIQAARYGSTHRGVFATFRFWFLTAKKSETKLTASVLKDKKAISHGGQSCEQLAVNSADCLYS